MTALDHNHLFAACRAIYEMAGENYMLPPLTRQAGAADAVSRHVYRHFFDDRELCFSVSLDGTRANRNAFPDAGLPVKFRVELRDAAHILPAVDLIGHEKFELVRAFLLGVMLPISLEKIDEGSTYRLTLQLATTYSVDCGEVVDVNDCRVLREICDSVGEAILNRTSSFFETRQSGLDVWSARAAQELFGHGQPSAEMLWPHEAPQTRLTDVVQAFAEPAAAGKRFQRYAIAASLLLVVGGTAVLGARATLRGENSAPQEVVRAHSVVAGDVLAGAIIETPAPVEVKPHTEERQPELSQTAPKIAALVEPSLAVVNLGVGVRSDLGSPVGSEPKRPPAARPVPPAPGRAAEARRNAAPASLPDRLFAALTPRQSAPQKPKARPRNAKTRATSPTLTRVIKDIERIPYRIAALIKT